MTTRKWPDDAARLRAGRILLPLLALVCLTPWVSPAMALAGGIVVALALGNPYHDKTARLTRHLLAWSIVGLGAGMNLAMVARAGMQGIGYTMASICAVLAAGFALGRVLKSDRDTSILISVGTAICGGSAIAAIAPVIDAKPQAVSVSLGVVFLLNALALLLFPAIGHALDLSQAQFGLWAALAIHDTSSVVGATLHYGAEALETGTTVKLVRALWIVPLALACGFYMARKNDRKNGSGKKDAPVQKPWFILGFIIVSAIVTWVPETQAAGEIVAAAARRALVLTLFLIGAGLTAESLKSVGLRPMVQGVLLWLLTLSAVLAAVVTGLLR